jgi:hypothetical protein
MRYTTVQARPRAKQYDKRPSPAETRSPETHRHVFLR